MKACDKAIYSYKTTYKSMFIKPDYISRCRLFGHFLV